ncbi:PP-loop family-domain-containing protein [Glomus cerebriforme]|uniref:tRNA(Ile)-lysidine synthetase n=1 Tax=Glomus cerebriforme TaxID=658196 RepID=A0A397T3Y7_9GLOM|nr:PP-loop family-domain-containing protein [Glomus cerebriforme]
MTSSLPISVKEFAGFMSKINLKHKERIGVAVSGGVDSMALCYLLNQYCKKSKNQITAFIIDHQLRKQSTKEAFQVSNMLSTLEINNKIMKIQWKDVSSMNPDIKINSFNSSFPTKSQYETFARIERYKLLAKGCHEDKISSLFVGHHLNDQLETLIMRFSRASGIDGLASMSIIDKFSVIRNIEAIGLQIIRPLLSVTKDRLRETCIVANIPWVEDPSNQSTDHKRNVVRFSLDKFNKRYLIEGKKEYEPLSTEGLLRFMSHMEYHKNCVNSKVNEIIKHSRIEFDKNNGICTLLLPNPIPSYHWILQKHLATRIISKIITFVKCSEQPPRLESVLRFYNHILSFSTLSHETFRISSYPFSHNITSRYNNITLNNVLLCHEKKTNRVSESFEDRLYEHWTFFRQPFTSKEETKNIIIIQNGQVVLWDKRFFVGINFVSQEAKNEVLKEKQQQIQDNNSIPLQSQYYIRKLCNKDIYDIIEMKPEVNQMLKLHSAYKDIFEKYKKNVPSIARFSIPVVIEKSYLISSDSILRESEKIVSIPTLGILLNPKCISCWAKFRGNVLAGIDEGESEERSENL